MSHDYNLEVMSLMTIAVQRLKACSVPFEEIPKFLRLKKM